MSLSNVNDESHADEEPPVLVVSLLSSPHPARAKIVQVKISFFISNSSKVWTEF
jgi:hypothetical protein